MTIEIVTSGYAETFTSSVAWSVQHNLGTDTPAVDVYDSDANGALRIMPSSVVVIDSNNLIINWSAATAGHVYVV